MIFEMITDALFDGFSNLALFIITVVFLYILTTTILDVLEEVCGTLSSKDPHKEQERHDIHLDHAGQEERPDGSSECDPRDPPPVRTPD